MKKLFLSFLPAIFSFCNLSAQKILPKFDQDEFGKKIVASDLYLEPDKTLCELNEKINIAVHIIAANEKAPVPLIFNYDYRDPFDAPWKIGAFKIISGGAQVGVTEGCTAQIIMPATMPKDKAVIVQVTLNPVTKEYQQIQLFATIYLEDNDNEFTFNCSYLGITAEKYVIKNNGGAFVKPDAASRNAAVSKNAVAQKRAQEYAMKSAAADISGTENGFNLAALTSNAKAVYSKEEKVTSIMINDDNIEMVNGKMSSNKRMYLVAFSFPGNATGTFIIKSKPTITASITLPKVAFGYTCSCSDDPPYRAETGDPEPPCMGGSIMITKYDQKAKIIEGRVNVHLQSANPKNGEVFFATLNGKFKVPLAN